MRVTVTHSMGTTARVQDGHMRHTELPNGILPKPHKRIAKVHLQLTSVNQQISQDKQGTHRPTVFLLIPLTRL